jgi:hypothetical protein
MNNTINMQEALDLRKEKVLDLKKQAGLDGQLAQVVLVLDFSGSMSDLYRSGSVQRLVERILPLGLAFDDNGQVDCYLFHNNVFRIRKPIERISVTNYITDNVLGKYAMGGTSYEPVITKIVEDFGKKKGGLFTRKTFDRLEYPVYVIFITDGDNDDKTLTESAIREASHTGIFFQFIGIGKSRFPFLERLDNLGGRNIDNANFFTVADLDNKTDDQLYSLLLTEFPAYVKAARAKNLIR